MPTPPPAAPDPKELAEAIRKNEQATEKVKDAADELAVIHVVLDQGVPPDQRSDDVELAVGHTGEIEKKLARSGELLDDVNRSLRQQAELLHRANAAQGGHDEACD